MSMSLNNPHIRDTGPETKAGKEIEEKRLARMGNISDQSKLKTGDSEKPSTERFAELFSLKKVSRDLIVPINFVERVGHSKAQIFKPDGLEKSASHMLGQCETIRGQVNGAEVVVHRRAIKYGVLRFMQETLFKENTSQNQMKEIYREIFGEAYGNGEEYEATINGQQIEEDEAARLFGHLENALRDRDSANKSASDTTFDQIKEEGQEIDEVDKRLQKLGRPTVAEIDKMIKDLEGLRNPPVE